MISKSIRIFLFYVLGIIMMFIVQPWLYDRGRVIRVSDVPLEVWLRENYIPGSTIVFITSAISTILWYVLASKAKIGGGRDYHEYKKYLIIWILLFLLPLISIVLALILFNRSSDALVSLILFYIIDVVLLFWLPTATSTPGNVGAVPVGADLVRK